MIFTAFKYVLIDIITLELIVHREYKSLNHNYQIIDYNGVRAFVYTRYWWLIATSILLAFIKEILR